MKPQDGVGFRLKLIHDALRVRADARLAARGLTLAQMRVLSCLAKAVGHAMPQKELEAAFSVKHPTMTGVLQRLEGKGLVQSSVNPADRRQRIISLSKQGTRLAEDMRKWPEQMEARLLRGLDGRETAELTRLLDRVYRNICEEPPADMPMNKPEDSIHD